MSLTLHAPAALLVWPLGAVAVVLVASTLSRDPEDVIAPAPARQGPA